VLRYNILYILYNASWNIINNQTNILELWHVLDAIASHTAGSTYYDNCNCTDHAAYKYVRTSHSLPNISVAEQSTNAQGATHTHAAVTSSHSPWF